MKHIIKYLLIGFSMLIATALYADSNPAVGYWKTIDDVTGKPKAIIQIWEASDHRLTGRILKIWPRPGYDQNELCAACSGDNHNKRIVGMVILKNLQRDNTTPNLWSNGTILDPKSGKVYKSNLQVIRNGQAVLVRGYIGIPLFGRSQTWLRVNSPTSN